MIGTNTNLATAIGTTEHPRRVGSLPSARWNLAQYIDRSDRRLQDEIGRLSSARCLETRRRLCRALAGCDCRERQSGSRGHPQV